MPIVNTQIPITSERNQRYLQQIAEKYPFTRLEQVGTTDFQRPIWMLTIGTGKRHVLFTAAHHANEWITALVLLQYAEELAEAIQNGGILFGQRAKEMAEAVTIHLIPMVNPDGVDLVTGAIEKASPQYAIAERLAQNYPDIPFPNGWKANLTGTDLNLNYPAGWLQAREIKFSQGYTRPGPRDFVGRAPLNQRESRALADYTEEIDPALVLAYHTQGKEIYWQFADIEVPGARELGEEFARLSGYALADTPYASSFAGYKDWFIQEFRRPGYTIEAGSGENPLPIDQFAEIYTANLPILVRAAQG
jgi:g-D-glutamyl-meso-diaminopimelate peptidase